MRKSGECIGFGAKLELKSMRKSSGDRIAWSETRIEIHEEEQRRSYCVEDREYVSQHLNQECIESRRTRVMKQETQEGICGV